MSDRDTFDEAERLYDAGHYRQAARLWASLPNDPDAAFNAANSYSAIDDHQRSIKWYRRAIAGGVREAYLNYGRVLQNLGRERKAIEAFREGAKRGDYGASLAYAEKLGLQGKRSRAIALSRRLLGGDDPRSSYAAVVLADNTLALDPFSDEAVELLAEALPKEPSAAAVIRDRLGGTSRENVAVRLLEEALSAGEVNAGIPLGRLYEDKGMLEEAERVYKAGAALGDRGSSHNLGLVLIESARPQEGKNAIEEAARAGDELAQRWLASRTDTVTGAPED
jgi:tetratricopeptide (TPR) repeat protein